MTFEEITALVSEQFGEEIVEVQRFGPLTALVVKPEKLAEICAFLKQDERTRLTSLMCLSGVDYPADSDAAKAAQEAREPKKPEKKEGEEGEAETAPEPEPEPTDEGPKDSLDNWPEGYMEVVYLLHSMPHNHRYSLKVRLPRSAPKVPSVSEVWRGARWFERETWDLMGIEFEGHGDLRRLMTPDDWVGHPLRKDYEYPKEYRGKPIARQEPGQSGEGCALHPAVEEPS